jgi:hypothetical protein
MAALYRRMAVREEGIDTHPLPEVAQKALTLAPK